MQHSWVSEGVIMVYNGGYECLCMDINKLYTSVRHIYFENILIGKELFKINFNSIIK